MSVKVNGMDMPKHCQVCPLLQPYSNYRCGITHKSYSWGLSGRPSDCPLEDVPEESYISDPEPLVDGYENHFGQPPGEYTNGVSSDTSERDNPNYPSGHAFTLCRCNKCGEYYEASYEHICKKKNSYPEISGYSRIYPGGPDETDL